MLEQCLRAAILPSLRCAPSQRHDILLVRNNQLATLPSSAPVPWCWAEADLKLIEGTELEAGDDDVDYDAVHVIMMPIPGSLTIERCDLFLFAVTAVKRARLVKEYGDGAGLHAADFASYADASACAISHANPWFGVSMVRASQEQVPSTITPCPDSQACRCHLWTWATIVMTNTMSNFGSRKGMW